MAVFGAGARRGCGTQGVAFELILPTMPHLAEAVREGVANWPVQPRVVIGEQEKRAAFRIAHAALAKSGTVTLELALAGVPMVTAYRTGAIEAWIMRRADQGALGDPRQSRGRRERHAGIFAGRLHAGETCRARCARCWSEQPLRRRQVEAFAKIDAIMSTGNATPSTRAADIVLATMRQGAAGVES